MPREQSRVQWALTHSKGQGEGGEWQDELDSSSNGEHLAEGSRVPCGPSWGAILASTHPATWPCLLQEWFWLSCSIRATFPAFSGETCSTGRRASTGAPKGSWPLALWIPSRLHKGEVGRNRAAPSELLPKGWLPTNLDLQFGVSPAPALETPVNKPLCVPRPVRFLEAHGGELPLSA